MRGLYYFTLIVSVVGAVSSIPLVVAALMLVPHGATVLLQEWGWALNPLLKTTSLAGLIALYLGERMARLNSAI